MVYTTYYGIGHRMHNGSETNPVTGNEFFTSEEAQQRIEELKGKGYISQAEYDQDPCEDVYVYDPWEEADEYLDDLISEEEEVE